MLVWSPLPRQRSDRGLSPHPKQQRLVAHGVLVEADHRDAVEPVRVVDQEARPSARTASLAVFHDTARPSATRGDREVLDHPALQLPTAAPDETASPVAPRPGRCLAAKRARNQSIGSGGP